MGYHHGDLRNTLLVEGRAFLREVGVDAISLRSLSRRIGVTHTAVYRHFPNKEALLEGVAVAGFADLSHATAAAIASAQGTEHALASAGLAYVDFAQQDPETFRLMFRRTARSDAQTTAAGEAFAVLERLVSDGQAEGTLRSGDPFLLALTLWSTVHGIARLVVDDALPPRAVTDGKWLAAAVSANLMRGVGAIPVGS